MSRRQPGQPRPVRCSRCPAGQRARPLRSSGPGSTRARRGRGRGPGARAVRGPAAVADRFDEVTGLAAQDVAQRGERGQAQPLRDVGDQPVDLLPGQHDAALGQQRPQLRRGVHVLPGHQPPQVPPVTGLLAATDRPLPRRRGPAPRAASGSLRPARPSYRQPWSTPTSARPAAARTADRRRPRSGARHTSAAGSAPKARPGARPRPASCANRSSICRGEIRPPRSVSHSAGWPAAP